MGYGECLENIYTNLYRTVLKCPIEIFFLGIIERYSVPIITIEQIKSVVIETMELSGIEVTFADKDWDNLTIVTETWGTHIHHKLNTKKGYMVEFFEY